MIIKLKINKDINYNANLYFDRSKKLKSKIPGILKIVEKTKKDIEVLKLQKDKYLKKREDDKILKNIPKKWYEKSFRHTITTNGFLFVIGKDSSTNEILLKKYLDKDDLVFHTEAPGSPFGILKNSNEKIKEKDLIEAGTFLACFSSSWKDGFGLCEVFYVKSNQISKTPKTKEFISKGSFIINGKKNFLKNIELKISLGFYFDEVLNEEKKIKVKKIISGETFFIKNKCLKFMTFTNGSQNIKEVNKKIKKKFGFQIENLSHYIPNDLRICK